MDACDVVDHMWERHPVKLHSFKWTWNPMNFIKSVANIHAKTLHVLLAERWNNQHPDQQIEIMSSKQFRRQLGIMEMQYKGRSGYWFEYEHFGTFVCLEKKAPPPMNRVSGFNPCPLISTCRCH